MPGEDGETGAGPGKRLIITHMTLENFKSYAGVQHIGPFHKVSKAGMVEGWAADSQCRGEKALLRLCGKEPEGSISSTSSVPAECKRRMLTQTSIANLHCIFAHSLAE